jgi:DNA-binding beta-propeller fold protein YncE
MKKLVPVTVIVISLLSCQSRPSSNDQSDTGSITFNLTELWATDPIMRTPESVLYDPSRNVLYVANMNRVEEGDDTGFISKLSTDGKVIELYWITSLNEPRGMGMYEGFLFATDMDRLLVIDVDKGEVQQTVPVEGALFLNDLTISEAGKVYFSDSRANKVHFYHNGEVTDWLQEVEGPNGLFNEELHMIVCATGEGEIRRTNKLTGEYDIMATGIRGDGIEHTGIGDYYIVSEWSGRIHIIGNDTVQTLLDTEEQKINTADLGYDIKNRVVYVPTFFDDRILAYKLEAE